MKIAPLITLFILATISPIHAQNDFTIQQADSDFEMDSFKDNSGVQVIKINDNRTKSPVLPSSELVYQVVKVHTSFELSKEWDQSDFERFYIKLQTAAPDELVKIYRGLTLEQIERLKLDFKKYE